MLNEETIKRRAANAAAAKIAAANAAACALAAATAAKEQAAAAEAEVQAANLTAFLRKSGMKNSYDRFMDSDHELAIGKSGKIVYYYLVAAQHRLMAALTTSDPIIRSAAAWALAAAVAKAAATAAAESVELAEYRLKRCLAKYGRGIVYYNLAKDSKSNQEQDSQANLLDYYLTRWSRQQPKNAKKAMLKLPARPAAPAKARRHRKHRTVKIKDSNSHRNKPRKPKMNRTASYMAGPKKPRYTEAWTEPAQPETPPTELVANLEQHHQARRKQAGTVQLSKKPIVPHKKFTKISLEQGFDFRQQRAKEWKAKYPKMKQQAWEDCCLSAMPNPKYTQVQYRQR